jgi:valyl-tRNA synthetase
LEIPQLAKTFDFGAIEQPLYRWWEKRGYFRPVNDPSGPGFDPSRIPYVIAIPPPNVTGELHLGSAMFVSVQDLLVRYHRMRGTPTLWIPGSDHAGIATQLQVERLLEQEGKRREDLGREAFVARVWQWKEKYGGIIFDQLRRLGASCDWERTRFTLDEGLSRAVRQAFVRLFEKGLIYRGPRLINWSPGLRTAVSDLEVEYSEEPGTLYFFKYQLKDSARYLPVATTRPETILGDTAVAVHPEDARYRDFVGRTVLVPILRREIPVISDPRVDREFGTGALKITPGHDPTDYQIGQDHGLAVISVLDEQARVNQAGGPYAGLDRFECRQRLWEDMSREGLTLKEEPYLLHLPRAQRGGEIIEPMISTQWFVRMKELAEPAIAAVRDGRIRILPEHFAKVYTNWLEAIQDWCISRQLWWGHRIPVWYCPDGHMTCTTGDPKQCQVCGNPNLRQDEDVLDTWFSSGLWPFSILGWPDPTPDLAYFYPTTVLETAYDILFFWVARMIMMGIEFTGQPPFHIVYLHGLVRDGQGRKMSKSAGNVIDPRWVIDGASVEQMRASGTSRELVEKYPHGLPAMGTDALRLTLLTSGSPGNDLNLSLERVEANRNFANKLWNVGRFVLASLERAQASTGLPRPGLPPTLADRWIRSRLAQVVTTATDLLDGYQFGEAGRLVCDFFWSEFADWYVEVSKLQLAEGGPRAQETALLLVQLLETSLRLLHPYTPYVTEELHGQLKQTCQRTAASLAPAGGWPEALIIAPWPMATQSIDRQALEEFALFMEVVRSMRNLRTQRKVPAASRLPARVISDRHFDTFRSMQAPLGFLAHLDSTRVEVRRDRPMQSEGWVALTVGPVEVHLGLTEGADPAAERARLLRDLEQTETQIQRLQTLLTSEFASRAPQAVVEKERARLVRLQQAHESLVQQLDGLAASSS